MRNPYTYFQNDKGEAIVCIKEFALGNYLYSKKPVSISWFDCRGSVGKYACRLDDSDMLNKLLISEVEQVLNSGEDIELDAFVASCHRFLNIFPKGKLALTLSGEAINSDHGFQDYFRFDEWDFICPPLVDKEQSSRKIGKYLEYFEESLKENDWVAGELIDFTSLGYYDGFSFFFIMTQDVEKLDRDRIQHYEVELQAGKRPYVLVYNDTTDIGSHYVLDGHHKLVAYKNQKLTPRILSVTQMTDEQTKYDFGLLCNDLFESLYEWQAEHIFKKGMYDSTVINDILKQPENPFNTFIKQGYVEEFWINGNLKSRGNYDKNEPTGVIDKFYENGNPSTSNLHLGNNNIRFLKSWYRSGVLSMEFIGDPKLNSGTLVFYRKDGSIERKEFRQ